MLIVAREVLYSPELISLILSRLRNHRALGRAALVCQRWYFEASRYRWSVRRQLSGLEHHVPAGHQKLIASFIRHLDFSLIDQIWEGWLSSMPTLVGLQTAILNTKVLNHQTGAQCLQKMLVGSLRELCIDTTTDDNLGPSKPDTCWLRTLRLNSTSLVTLSLDVQLSAWARDQLELFLLDTRIQRLTLGPLLNYSLDDWSVALILAQQSLVTLEIHKPITKQALEILQQQFHELRPLEKLQGMEFTIYVSDEGVVSSLLGITPELVTLDMTLHHITETGPWCPPQPIFDAISQLQHLSHVKMVFDPRLSNGKHTYTVATTANLLTLSMLPLMLLCVISLSPDLNHILKLSSITGTELLFFFSKWTTLTTLQLDVACAEIFCDTKLKVTICSLLSAPQLSRFHIIDSIDEDSTDLATVLDANLVIDHDVWLGINKAYCPDPMKWEPRRLQHGAQTQTVAYMVKEGEERDELLVWGEGGDNEFQELVKEEEEDLKVEPIREAVGETSTISEEEEGTAVIT
jgi:hypothetical protein